MKVYKYFIYVYLFIAGFFLFDAIEKYNNGESYWLSLLFVATCIFLFFFRRNFAKKIEERRKKGAQQQ